MIVGGLIPRKTYGLLSWETTCGYIVREERSLRNLQFGHHRELVLYKCQKPDHRATDCRSTQSSSSDLHKSDGFVYTCYACGVVGHKSPDCPSKTSNSSKRVEVKKEPENAGKLKKKSFKQAEVSMLYNGPTNTSLYGQPLPLLLDTGAQL